MVVLLLKYGAPSHTEMAATLVMAAAANLWSHVRTLEVVVHHNMRCSLAAKPASLTGCLILFGSRW